MSAPVVKFKPGSFLDVTYVMVDGRQVAWYRKRVENYSGIRRGGRYTYFDVYPLELLRKVRSRDDMIGCDSIRRRAVAEALVALGLDEAARTVDRDHAEFRIDQRNERQAKEATTE